MIDIEGAGYPKGDDQQSRRVLERAFSCAVKIGGLVVTKDTEVEVMQAASSQNRRTMRSKDSPRRQGFPCAVLWHLRHCRVNPWLFIPLLLVEICLLIS